MLDSTDIECCDSGSRPPCCAATATPFSVWVCSTHFASCRPSWMALWMMKPAALTGNGESSSLLPSVSIFTRLEAEISSKKTPYGLMRNWSSAPGMRSEMCVKTRSSQPKSAHARYAAARSTRAAHSSGETLSLSEGMSRAAGFIVCPFERGSNVVELRHVIASDLAAHALGEAAEVLLENLARIRTEAVRMR